MKARACIVAVALLAAARLGAVESAPYLITNEGVRSSALAGAFGAVQGSSESLWYNPAGLPGLSGVEATLAHMSFPGAWDSDHLTLAAPLHWTHYLGLLYHRNGTQDTLRDATGAEGGSFEVSQSVLGLAYARRLGRFQAGVLAKDATEVIGSRSASALLFDAGLQRDLSRERVRLGLAVQNLGSAPDLGGVGVSAPGLLRASSQLHFAGDVSSLDLMADYRWRWISQRSSVAVAVEYSEHYQEGRLGLRAGWDFGLGDLGGAAGLAMGLGFGYGPVGLDYAWTPMEALGSQHRVALTLLWDLRARQKAQDLAEFAQPSAPAPAAAPQPQALQAQPVPQGRYRESAAGSRLDQALAAQPTPQPTMVVTPSAPAPRPHGLLGFFARFFGGAPAADAQPQAGPSSLLKAVFGFFGVAPSDAPAPAALPTPAAEQPTPAPTPTALPMQRLKGDAEALPPPTPVPTPVAQKLKSWMKL